MSIISASDSNKVLLHAHTGHIKVGSEKLSPETARGKKRLHKLEFIPFIWYVNNVFFVPYYSSLSLSVTTFANLIKEKSLSGLGT